MKKKVFVLMMCLSILLFWGGCDTADDSNGLPTLVWEMVYDSGNGDWCTDVAVDASGSVFVSAVTHNGTNKDWRILKYNADGNLLWEKTWDSGKDDDEIKSIAVDKKGNLYAAGFFTNGLNYDHRLAKYDSSGNLIWEKVYDSGGTDVAQSIALDNAGNVYLAGWCPGPTNTDFYYAMYDTNGNKKWQKLYDSGQVETAYGIAVDAAGFLYVKGRYITGDTDNPDDFQTIKCDPNGNLVWSRIWDSGRGEGQLGNTIAVDSLGSSYICGWFSDGSNNDGCVICYDSDGSLVWNQTLDSGINYNEGAHGIVVDTEGFVYVNGDFSDGTNEYCRTIKFDSNGNVLWNTIYDSVKGRGIAVNSGYVYVVCRLQNSDMDILTIKYEQH